MLRITDKEFRYVPSHETDLRKKFRKLRQELQAAEAHNLARAAQAAAENSVVEMALRRGAPKS